jgi:RimK family alpha-L-glutamate ligase
MPPSVEHLRRRRRRFGPRIVLFTAARDWHARVLAAALRRCGSLVTMMRLEDCVFDSTAPFGLRIGALARLPQGAIVRTVSAGSFEAVTRRLGVLHALKTLGVPVWNEATAIERCVDKSMTSFLLGQAGLPVPPTWTVESLEAAKAIVTEHAGEGPLVLKPLFGSQGRGLALVREPADVPPPEEVAGVYYLQRFVGRPGPLYRDFRVFVIEGEPIALMARRGTSWITNVKQGGRPEPVAIDPELAALASAAAEAVGARFCGVDILRGAGGAPCVLEVNSMPAWSGLQSVSEVNIADVLAARFVRIVSDIRSEEAA